MDMVCAHDSASALKVCGRMDEIEGWSRSGPRARLQVAFVDRSVEGFGVLRMAAGQLARPLGLGHVVRHKAAGRHRHTYSPQKIIIHAEKHTTKLYIFSFFSPLPIERPKKVAAVDGHST